MIKEKLFLALGDTPYIWAKFLVAHRRIPRRNSGLFNDYLFFRKVGHTLEDELVVRTSDKIESKTIVKNIVPTVCVPQTLAVINTIDQLHAFRAPQDCVLKPSHGSGSVVFLKKGERLSGKKLARALSGLHQDLYRDTKQKNYRPLQRRLICEEMLPAGEDILDYKIFCFGGSAKAIQVDSQRHTDHRRNMYLSDWSRLDIKYNFPPGDWISSPEGLREMLEYAEAISAKFEFARVDFFIADTKIYFGEVTHCPEAAHGRFGSISQERIFSNILFGDRSCQVCDNDSMGNA